MVKGNYVRKSDNKHHIQAVNGSLINSVYINEGNKGGNRMFLFLEKNAGTQSKKELQL